jgi:hypothetical protein
MYDRIGGFVAGIGGTVVSIIGAGRSAVYTSRADYACLGAVTERIVVAISVIGRMYNRVGSFIASVGRTVESVVGAGRSSIDTSRADYACLGAVTERIVVAISIIGRMDNFIVDLVASVGRTFVSIIGAGRSAVYTS